MRRQGRGARVARCMVAQRIIGNHEVTRTMTSYAMRMRNADPMEIKCRIAKFATRVIAAGLIWIAWPAVQARAQSQSEDVAGRCKRATVMVMTSASKTKEGDTPYGSGSGCFINRTGLCMSNNHVVDPGHHKSQQEKFQLKNGLGRLVWEIVVQGGTDDEKVYKADVLYQNETADLALLQAHDENGAYLQSPDYLNLVSSRRLRVGDKAWCYGFPGGDSRKGDQGKHARVAVSEGHIVGLPRRPDGDLSMIETDVLANPGNSGGPFVNREGDVIGALTLGSQTKNRTNTTMLVPGDLMLELITVAFQRGKMPSGIDLDPLYDELVGTDGYMSVPGYDRSSSSDCIFMADGPTICGAPEGESLSLVTPLGKLTLPRSQMAYLLAKDDDVGIILMDGGQRLPFVRADSVIRFVPQGGKVMEQALDEVKVVAFRKGNKLPAPPAGKNISLGGDDFHLLLRDVSGEIKFASENAGEVAMPLERIAKIATVEDERIVHTTEGSAMTGEFAPHSLKAVLAINGAPQTLSFAEVRNASVDVVDHSTVKKERSLVELFKDASPDLKDLAKTLESSDASGVNPRLAKLTSPEVFNKEGPLKKDQIRLLNAVSHWRAGDYSEAAKQLRKLKSSEDENILWYSAAIASVFEKYPDGKYNSKPLSDAKVFKEAGLGMAAESLRRARELLGERGAPVHADRGLFMRFRKRFESNSEDLMMAGWLGSAAADDLLVRVWNFQADMLENEIFRLQEDIEKKEEEVKQLQPAEQEFKGRKIQDQIKGLVRDRDATIKWRVELAEQMATFGFIIDDPDIELVEKS